MRDPAGHPGYLIQAPHDGIPALAELGEHAIHFWRPRRERRGSRALDERRGAGDGVGDELRDRLHERARKDPIPQAPAGHREGLAKPVEEDRALRHSFLEHDRTVRAVVHELAIDFVGKHPEVALARVTGDLTDRLVRQHPARRVVGAVEDDHLRAIGHQVPQLVEVRLEVVALAERKGHATRTREIDHRGVDGKAGVRVDRFIARVEQGEQCVEHDWLRARRDDDLRRIDGEAAPRPQICGDRVAELDDTGGWRVVRLAPLERRDAGRDHRGRRVEVRLADLQMDDVAAFRLERSRLREHLECGLGAEAGHSWGERSHRKRVESRPLAASLRRTRSPRGRRPPNVACGAEARDDRRLRARCDGRRRG